MSIIIPILIKPGLFLIFQIFYGINALCKQQELLLCPYGPLPGSGQYFNFSRQIYNFSVVGK